MCRNIVLVLMLAVLASAASNQTEIRTNPPAAYQMWLQKDVAYIITDAERARFYRQDTDEQYKAFIQQFWESRNPDPGNPTNAFKEEHYRRLAYANEHFAETGKAGWQTDRGHIYIVLGPPDEIESYRTEGRDMWSYNRFQGTAVPMTMEFHYTRPQ